MTQPIKYISNARWPRGTVAGYDDYISTDYHETFQQAEKVCEMLEDEGFGGDGKIFPVETWVSTL